MKADWVELCAPPLGSLPINWKRVIPSELLTMVMSCCSCALMRTRKIEGKSGAMPLGFGERSGETAALGRQDIAATGYFQDKADDDFDVFIARCNQPITH